MNGDMAVTRLDPDGSFNTGFDGDGSSGADLGSFDFGYAAVLQPDGKIVIAAYTTDSGGNYDFAVARLQPGGTLDRTFSFDGKTALNLGGAEYVNAIALQANGRIVLAGNTTVDSDVAVARLDGDPLPSAGGGAGGGPGAGSRAGRRVGRAALRRATGDDRPHRRPRRAARYTPPRRDRRARW